MAPVLKLVGAKVPGSESFKCGTFAPGSEWSWERKVHNSQEMREEHDSIAASPAADLHGQAGRTKSKPWKRPSHCRKYMYYSIA